MPNETMSSGNLAMPDLVELSRKLTPPWRRLKVTVREVDPQWFAEAHRDYAYIILGGPRSAVYDFLKTTTLPNSLADVVVPDSHLVLVATGVLGLVRDEMRRRGDRWPITDEEIAQLMVFNELARTNPAMQRELDAWQAALS